MRLLRRVLTDVSLLALADIAADIGSAVAAQLIGLVAARATEAGLAAQRMSRFGLLTMAAYRHVPFDPRDVPGLRDIMAAVIPSAADGGRLMQ